MSVCLGSKKDGYVKLSEMNKIKLTQLTAPQLSCIPETEEESDNEGDYTATTSEASCECDSPWTSLTKNLNMNYVEMLLVASIVIVAAMVAYKLLK
ncbi:hypothetical protein LDVICp014 [lymphocystis disease virus-China]|uniref:Uncharacterized protein n=2 Tax=Lymphocystis disease virus 2 TaxID=159183 RepID=A0A6F8X1H4_9VIRU|nr:hypothetical protein LDVICp014 [lymphocystis disease virus-China]AAU10862.1 hypothetical protein [lymphocystis disease virus-China]BCB67420.1 hypothetical protein [Lymphocystis disease virus 2]